MAIPGEFNLNSGGPPIKHLRGGPMKSIFRSLLLLFVFAGIGSAQSIYFPQVANGVQGNTQWSTAIGLTNAAALGSAAAVGTLAFTQDNGTPLTVSLFDEQNRFLG